MAVSPTEPDIKEIFSWIKDAASSEKCWSCGCMHRLLKAIAEILPVEKRPAELETAMQALRQRLTEAKYDCLGCEVCFSALAINALKLEGNICHAEEVAERQGWPPLAGDYTILRYQAPVAVCTLTDEKLCDGIAAAAGPEIAIIGTLQTENLGIERLVMNIVANPNIRFLLVCGPDSRRAIGHLPGQTLVSLAHFGIDEDSRVIGARGKRPYLKNISKEAVEHFRKTVEVVDLIGDVQVQKIINTAQKCAERSPGPVEPFTPDRKVTTIKGYVPRKMISDPAGYFVIYVDRSRKVLSMEHYRNDGLFDVAIEGRTAAELYIPAIEKRLVSRLDHAAYLGHELARAEQSLLSDEPYIQDRAPERAKPLVLSSCGCEASCAETQPKKRWAMLACVGIVAAILAASWHLSGQNRESNLPAAIGLATESVSVLSVEEFMKNVDRHRGSVRVEGVVSAVLPEKEMLALVDVNEFKRCGVNACAEFTLPVRWSGSMPLVRDTVQVEGETRETDGKLVFVARTIEKISQSEEDRGEHGDKTP